MGLDLGLHRTGRFELLACVEKEKAFAQTIERNRDSGRLGRSPFPVINEDICSVDPDALRKKLGMEVGELDVLIGGPPCQSFSTAGKRGTVQDHRGTLLWQFLRFIEAFRPKFFLMENVRGLLSAALRHRPIRQRPEHGGPPLAADERPGSVVAQFAEDLGKLHGAAYRMDCFEVNAVNYGAPQLRERALFIGNRFNDLVEFPKPTHGAPAPPGRNGQQNLFENAEAPRPWRTLRDAIGSIKEQAPIIMDFSPRKKRYLAMVPPGSNWRSMPIAMQKESMGPVWKAKGGRSGWWRRLSFDLPCPTLMTMPNHASTSLCHPSEIRALSLKEYQLIQEFPEDWEFCGTPAQQYAQAGNAVPVRLGEVAGQTLAAHLDRLGARRCRPYAQEGVRYRVIYMQSHVRTRQWFKDGNVLVWKDGQRNSSAAYGPPRTERSVRSLSHA